jgi:hypothetical protein
MSNNPNESDLIISYSVIATLYIPIIEQNGNITPNEMIQKEVLKHRGLNIAPIISTCELYNNENFSLNASIRDSIEVDHGYLNEPELIPHLIKSDIITKYGKEDMIEIDVDDIGWEIQKL